METILEVKKLNTNFKIGNNIINIVKDVSFEVYKGKMLAIVGESGCGKSVTMHSAVRLLPRVAISNSEHIKFKVSKDKTIDLSKFKYYDKEIRSIRGNSIGMVFQDPMASLNPVYTVGMQVAENLLEHNRGMKKKEALDKVVSMFESLGISDAKNRIDYYPHQFSGGMKQRVMIAIAMICNPDLLIADEPTTALDVTVQAQIMELMKKIQEEDNKSIVLITHNMGLVAESADYVAVMYMGRVVEYGNKEAIFRNPSHPYTIALLDSVPVLGKKLVAIDGSTPNPADYIEGCEFAPRCKKASEKCFKGEIDNYEIADGHRVRCLLYEDKKKA